MEQAAGALIIEDLWIASGALPGHGVGDHAVALNASRRRATRVDRRNPDDTVLSIWGIVVFRRGRWNLQDG